MEDKHLSFLISNVAKGDMRDFEELYNLMKRGVYSFALSHANNRQLAEDVVQETFLHILKASKNYTHQNPKAWILTISRNISLNMLRKIKNEVSSDENSGLICASSEDFVDDICSSTVVRTLLTKLEPNERQIIVLHLVCQLKHWEMAEILRLPLGTVLWKYSKAIKKLKNLVELGRGDFI